ncbi:MAG: hypothetical protein GAK29_00837 [Acinetobacter bereziniae]|uniref:Uncharacterized protein n=1 Tax=Acinetobacter bereziniae TaxID=106648 RepID=A0A833PJF9_ACIBZ|nr:MAG: hypothetical protein GAK29_00837 [Acinetobacter bereziniae]
MNESKTVYMKKEGPKTFLIINRDYNENDEKSLNFPSGNKSDNCENNGYYKKNYRKVF